MNWIKVEDRLPEVSGFTSGPLLFASQGESFAGHYHANGWFYENSSRHPEIMAYGHKNRVMDFNCPERKASHWAMLPEAPTS